MFAANFIMHTAQFIRESRLGVRHNGPINLKWWITNLILIKSFVKFTIILYFASSSLELNSVPFSSYSPSSLTHYPSLSIILISSPLQPFLFFPFLSITLPFSPYPSFTPLSPHHSHIPLSFQHIFLFYLFLLLCHALIAENIVPKEWFVQCYLLYYSVPIFFNNLYFTVMSSRLLLSGSQSSFLGAWNSIFWSTLSVYINSLTFTLIDCRNSSKFDFPTLKHQPKF